MKNIQIKAKLFFLLFSVSFLQSCVPNGGGGTQAPAGSIKNIYPGDKSLLNMYKQIKPTYNEGKVVKIDYYNLNGAIVKTYNVTRSGNFIYINYTPRNGAYGIQNTMIEVLPERPNYIKRIINAVQKDATTFETDTVLVDYIQQDSSYLVTSMHVAMMRSYGNTFKDYLDILYSGNNLLYYNLYLKYCNALEGNCENPIAYEYMNKPTYIIYSDTTVNRLGMKPPYVEFDYLILEMLNLSYGTEPTMMMEFSRYDGVLHGFELTINEDKRIKQEQNLITYY